jgi:hypothetical protein
MSSQLAASKIRSAIRSSGPGRPPRIAASAVAGTAPKRFRLEEDEHPPEFLHGPLGHTLFHSLVENPQVVTMGSHLPRSHALRGAWHR